jgi:hypothetical protein
LSRSRARATLFFDPGAGASEGIGPATARAARALSGALPYTGGPGGSGRNDRARVAKPWPADWHRRLAKAGQSEVRSSSFSDVFERVFASTFLTMTAQYSEYLPSFDGRLPATTTEPAGTRP